MKKNIFSSIQVMIAIMILLISVQSSIFAADTEPSAADNTPATVEKSIDDLAQEVDMLQAAADLGLKSDQLGFIITRIKALKVKYDETTKQEAALQKEIKEPLTKMREFLIAGKPVPAEIKNAAYSKLPAIRKTREAMQDAVADAGNACVDMLDEGQMRILGRTPDVMSRAQAMIQQIRSAPESNWPDVMDELTSEIVQVKQMDRYTDWQQQIEAIRNMEASQREQAYAEFDAKQKTEIEHMTMETQQLLDSVRSANNQVLPIALNRLAGALKSQTELRQELFGIMMRILDNKNTISAFQAKLDAAKETAPAK